tara:strand:- start:813 stop:986 length:174 start_codon:yes stop_codon:yes gene_type:complete
MIDVVYKILENDVLIGYKVILTDGVAKSVPLDEANTDFIAIQEWIADGNTVIDNPPE